MSFLFLPACESKKQPRGEAQGVAAEPSDNASTSAAQEEPAPGYFPSSNTTQDITKKTLNTPKGVSKVKLVLKSKDNVDTVTVVASGGEGADFKYEWTKNSEPAGNGDSLSGFKRGDKIAVKITPFDGKNYGQPKTLTTEIKNSTPKVVEGKQIDFDGKILTAQVKAIDPDGDALSYSLMDAPPQGMAIDQASGIIKWEVPKEFHGKQKIKVKISDGHGAEVLYELNADISAVKSPEKQK
ncbi:MAG: cadherin repeat domain-containing protein [Nitrospirae bacterium]|nr:cadherin repeat domain-containing protein [Nitrospirota bacterium]MCL5238735.1 cadherin repeat domain-containing protein [Nitrospirota bacterium]